jgi:hypothetical protein
VAGTVIELLLLATATFKPPVGAGPDKLTVHESASDPVIEMLLQPIALTVGRFAAPAPDMLTVTVGALLVMVTIPVKFQPGLVRGLKVTVMIAAWPGFKVTGVPIPVAPNREPATEIDEIVTGAVPEEVKATVAVAVVATVTLPNDTDGELTFNAGVPLAGDNEIAKVVVIPPACSVMTAV